MEILKPIFVSVDGKDKNDISVDLGKELIGKWMCALGDSGLSVSMLKLLETWLINGAGWL